MFPADTPVVYFHVSPWPELENAWRPSHIIHAIREGHRQLDQSMITGLLTMPSYHAVAAALFAWALYPIKSLRWAAIALNVAMFVLTVVIGAHYVVDLFGGIAIAVASIFAARQIVKEPNHDCDTSSR
jgi:membrane-associated phospholipid phosphatase